MPGSSIHTYSLGGSMLRQALLHGLEADADGVLRTIPGSTSPRYAIFPALNSATEDFQWGRLSFDGQIPGECILRVRAFAANEDSVVVGDEVRKIDDLLLDPQVPQAKKERLFLLGGGSELAVARDVLLTGQTGRHLWLWLEIAGDADVQLQRLRVYAPGDNFARTFPAVYQTQDDFFSRYLSVLSTLYQEFQEQLDHLPDLLDVDTAPEVMLPVLASWMGLDLGDGLLTTRQQRDLLRLAPELIARKGTRWAVESVVRLLVEGHTYVVERNLLSPEERRSEDIYGNSPYDFTVMLPMAADERLRLRLHFLIDQFKPIRACCRIVFLDDCGGLDAFTYLDVNSSVLQSTPGNLDDGDALTGMTYLQ